MRAAQVGTLRREAAELQVKIAEAERLLRLADPDGYYREGTRAAEAAKARGVKALAVERARAAAAEKQRRERLVRGSPGRALFHLLLVPCARHATGLACMRACVGLAAETVHDRFGAACCGRFMHACMRLPCCSASALQGRCGEPDGLVGL
jgi:hypothetical protein